MRYKDLGRFGIYYDLSPNSLIAAALSAGTHTPLTIKSSEDLVRSFHEMFPGAKAYIPKPNPLTLPKDKPMEDKSIFYIQLKCTKNQKEHILRQARHVQIEAVDIDILFKPEDYVNGDMERGHLNQSGLNKLFNKK